MPSKTETSAVATGLAALAMLLALSSSAQEGDFTHYESAHVHPLALSEAGDLLYAVNTPEALLAIFEVDAQGGLGLAGEVPVGLEPVSLAVRPGGSEVWIANHLSDSVSVVDTRTRRLVDTLYVGDEPTDVRFASGRAFVALSGRDDAVVVLDAATRSEVRRIAIPGEDPRALVASADGSLVLLVVLDSGNGTTAIHSSRVGASAPPPDPPRSPDLGPAPGPMALIVRRDPRSGAYLDELGRDWSAVTRFAPSDRDLFFIDAAGAVPRLVGTLPGMGTTLFDVAIRPQTSEIWIPNTDARNQVRFEPNLKGHLVDTRVTAVSFLTGVRTIDLNPHIDYDVLPAPPGEIEQALSQPVTGVFSADGALFYLAAFGSEKVAVLDAATGEILHRIRVGGGPSGLAVQEAARRLYVLNRFDQTISTVDLDARVEIDVVGVAGPARFDPSPASIRDGRRLLYDAASSSGHGDIACATCHVFGNFDGLAWDLGDPQGAFVPYSEATWVRFLRRDVVRPGFDPMKGPMTTQTLRGLRGMEPFHWRGDRRDFQHFNGAFVSLLGREEPLPAADMDLFADFIMTVELPPNPYLDLDGSLPRSVPVVLPGSDRPPALGDAQRGRERFLDRCDRCHRLPKGTPNELVDSRNRPQDFKVPHLRNIYEKVDLEPLRSFDIPVGTAPKERKRGFMVLNDGVVELPALVQGLIGRIPQDLADIQAFVLSLPTESFPCVGHQLTLAGDAPAAEDELRGLATLVDEAEAGHCDLVAKGVVDDEVAAWVYDPSADGFAPASVRAGVLGADALRESLQPGDLVTWMGVPPGSGRRMGIDRDRDGCLDGDERRLHTNPAHPGVALPDSDEDGIEDEADLCAGLAQSDPSQTDTNHNGVPDECECGDVNADAFLDLRDWVALLRYLLGRDPEGVVPERCNVQGLPGTGPGTCDFDDLATLGRGLLRSRWWWWRSTPLRFEPLCLPQVEVPDPPPRVCVDGPRGG